MILTAFRLARDRYTEGSSFGYQRPLWPRTMRHAPHYTPDVGCPIERDASLVTNIIKIVEFYRRSAGDVVIERLAWRFNDHLYPYRTKYLTTQEASKTVCALVFLPHLSGIHSQLGNRNVLFASPLQYYLDTEGAEPWCNPEMHGYVSDLYQKHWNVLAGITQQEADCEMLRDFLYAVDDDYLLKKDEGYFQNFFLPVLPMAESISQHYVNRALPIRNVVLSQEKSFFDVAEPPPLPIRHPEVTRYSPPEYHRIACLCEEISQHYTDVKVDAVLSNGAVVQTTSHWLISRYVDKPDPLLVARHCHWLLVEIALLHEKTQGNWLRQVDLKISFELSYGDEALIELSVVETGQCLVAVHLDLAMIALCSSGVIAQSA